jgi:hypothetical protein
VEIDVGIVSLVFITTRADLEVPRRFVRLVDEAMSVRDSGGKAGALAGSEHLLPLVGDQRQLADEDEDEFVLVRVPMP